MLLSWVCERLIAKLLTRRVIPRAVPDDARSVFWCSLCHLFSAHLVCSTGIVSLFIFLVVANADPSFMFLFFLGGLVAVLVWWWFCLGRAIAARGLPCAARTVIVCSIPAIGFATALLGWMIFLACGLLCFS